MADNELPTMNDLKRLRVVDLKEKLNELELSTSGLKADLVNRLYEAYQQSVYNTSNNADDGTEIEGDDESVSQNEREDEEEVKRQEEEEEEIKRQEEEEERIRKQKEVEEEVARKQKEVEEEIARKQKEEEERERREKEEEEEKIRKQREEEKLKKQREDEERAKKEKEEKLRKQKEEERMKKQKEEEEIIKKKKEEEERLKKQKEEDEERLKKQREEERIRKKKEEERIKKLKEEEKIKKQKEEEEKRLKQQERLKKEEAMMNSNKFKDSIQPALPRIEAAAGPQKPQNGAKPSSESFELPQALEKALAFKSERAQQVGVSPEDVDTMDVAGDADAEGEDEDDSVDHLLSRSKSATSKDSKAAKELKNKHKKKKKKRRTKIRQSIQEQTNKEENNEGTQKDENVEIEYIQESVDVSNPNYLQFMKIFDKFKLNDPSIEGSEIKSLKHKNEVRDPEIKKKGPPSSDEDTDIEETDKDDKPKLSKRQQKLISRLSVAQLKQRVSRPDLVEMHDVTAKDPEILLALKASRNSVPVPRHWCFKRKYLQGKRGIEKPPFDLPYFIKKTGIMEMRQALADKEDQKNLKAKMRERIRPKMGKIDIDYQKLHDAFFKWQTKPKMTIHGDLYYEGKEFETKMKDKKPGDLSDELRTALGMPVGPNCLKVPPPWLIAMQRYGPPPSYPNLKIPGLNAPIPDGCSFGYHAGGWGKPPVDEMGRPLYGDVFGIQNADYQNQLLEEVVDKSLWGELESESSESSEEEEEEEEEGEEEGEKEIDQSGLVTPADGGLITPSGITSIPAGMETPDMIELRKRKIEADMEGGDTPALYTILPEKKSEKVGTAMMGSTHVYDMSAAISKKAAPGAGATETTRKSVDVALDPSELDMDTAAMAARYEQTVREQESQIEKEDLSDMVAEHAAKQKSKRKKAQQDTGKAAKRYKEFKF